MADLSSIFITTGVVEAAIKSAAPIWMNTILPEMQVTAIANAPKAFSTQRTFNIHVQTLFNECNGFLNCRGPRVQVRAWDLEFTPPGRGYKMGDYDPLTGESFPGGENRRGSFVELEDKPEYGEPVRYRHSTWSRGGKAGVPHFKEGFFSAAIRHSIGTNARLSPIGETNLTMLSTLVAFGVSNGIADKIRATFAGTGITVTVSRPMLQTEGGFTQL